MRDSSRYIATFGRALVRSWPAELGLVLTQMHPITRTLA